RLGLGRGGRAGGKIKRKTLCRPIPGLIMKNGKCIGRRSLSLPGQARGLTLALSLAPNPLPNLILHLNSFSSDRRRGRPRAVKRPLSAKNRTLCAHDYLADRA